MEKHLVLIDLDGTTIKKDQSIDDITKQAIQDTVKLGHEVIIVTGRADYRSRFFYHELGLKTLLVNRNSGHIHHPVDQEFVELFTFIDPSIVNKLFTVDILDKIEQLYFENKNTVYVLKGEKTFYSRYELCQIADLDIKDYKDPLTLITLHVKKEHTESMLEFYNQFEEIKCELFHFREHTDIINIYPTKADKVNSLAILSNHYNVPISRIIALGDGLNDVNLIKEAGIGVAMLNAIDEVKQVAKMITEKSNEECGVGLFLRDYFKL